MPISAHDKVFIIEALTQEITTTYCCGLFSKKEKQPFTIKTGWKNFTRNQEAPEAWVLEIENVKTLQNLMRAVNNLNNEKKSSERITLRVAAGGKNDDYGNAEEYSESFSFTPCVNADLIIQLVGSEFQEITLLDSGKKLVRVGAAVQIGELNQTLYKGLRLGKAKKIFPLSLPTASLIPYVTFVGLADNAGHGTGLNQPSVSGLIRALTFCRPDGELVRIDEQHPDFETIRACYFSLFGVVLHVEIECMEAKKLQAVSEARTVAAFMQEVKEGLIQKNSYVSAMYIPTYDEFSESPSKNTIISRWEPVPLDLEDTNNLAALNQLEQIISIKLFDLLDVGKKLSQHPYLIPSYMRNIVSKIEVGTKDNLAVGPLPDLWHYQTAFPRNIDDADYLFPVKADNHKVLLALQHVIERLNHYATKEQYPVVDAIYLRFLKGTNGGLSTSFHHADEYICAFDIVSDPSVPGYSEFKKEIGDFFMKELGARPHWGKSVPLTVNYAELYGKGYDDFMQALQSWHTHCKLPLAKSPFLNAFFCQILQLPFTPGVSLEQDERIDSAQERSRRVLRTASASYPLGSQSFSKEEVKEVAIDEVSVARFRHSS